MTLHFSTSFGFENVYPLLVSEGQALHGHQYLGSKGLLEWLELHLGYTQKDVNNAIRVLQYKKVIAKMERETSHPELYIWSSFQNDAWKSAKRLLQWRDELVLAHYDFDCQEQKLQRLYALSKIEDAQDGDLPKGVNDRWVDVYEELVSRNENVSRNQNGHELIVYEPIHLMHPFFQKLFEALKKNGCSITEKEYDYPVSKNTDLAKVQNKFKEPASKDTLTCQQDGSLAIFHAENEQLLAEAISMYVDKEDLHDTVFVIPERGDVLEAAFTKRDFPRMGYVSTIENAGLDQLFSLFSLFLWKPINPEKLIQFLTLPRTPLSRKLQSTLAYTYANLPGIGNDDWNEAVEKYMNELPEKQKKKEESLFNDLFGRKLSFDADEGASPKSVLDLYEILRSWAVKEIKTEDEEKRRIFHRLKKMCEDFMDLVKIESQQNQLLSERTIKSWQEAVHENDHYKLGHAEIGAPTYVKQASNICQKAKQIIWWNFLDYGNPLKHFSDWDKAEEKVLAGFWTYAKKDIIASWYWKMKQAILMAEEKLILCIPDKKMGELAESNPLLNDLKAWITNLESIYQEVDITSDAMSVGEKKVSFESVPAAALPFNQVYHQLDPKLLSKFKKGKAESFSSLEKLIHYPAQYLLKYLLKIRPNNIPEVSVSNLLKGNVAHKLAEVLLKEEKNLKLPEDKFEEKILSTLEELIEKEASIFLLKKNQISLQAYKPKVIKAIKHLRRLIQKGAWEVFGVEKAMDTNAYDNMELSGILDLILKKGNRFAIVDLKWGGYNKRMNELVKEEDLQLLIYYKLLLQKHANAKIDMAYYIISEQRVLTRTKDLFEDVEAISIVGEESEVRANLWAKLVKTIKYRQGQFAEGKVEVGEGIGEKEFEAGGLWDKNSGMLSMRKKGDKYKVKAKDNYSDYKKFSNQ